MERWLLKYPDDPDTPPWWLLFTVLTILFLILLYHFLYHA